MWNQATRDHYRVVRCEQCPQWMLSPGRAPVKAHTLASRHAKRHPGHCSVVIDVTLLEVEHRYQFDALPDHNVIDDHPPF